MPFPWKAVAVGAAVVSGIGALLRASRKDTSTPPKRVALIGDSYAVGLGPELQKLLPDFKYAGVVGTDTAEWSIHSAACGSCGDWLTTFKPDIVLISLGANDGFTLNTAHAQTIVRGLHGIGARVVWIQPPAGVQAPALHAAIDALGVQTVPATQVPLANDGIHPRGAGYRTWAQEIAATVMR